MTEKELNTVAHQQAYGLLNNILTTQPELLRPAALTEINGKNAGQFIASLYDELVVLTRRWAENSTHHSTD